MRAGVAFSFACRAWVAGALLLRPPGLRAQDLPPDIVAITARDMPALLGTRVDEIRAWSQHDGSLVAAHVQIDQRVRDTAGALHYAFESGEDPRPAAPQLAPDDLLLLATTEAGDHLPSAPADATALEIVDPPGDRSRWLYVGRGASAPSAPAIRYDEGADRITGSDYAVQFSRGGTALIDALILGDPEHGANILDRNKARLDVELALGLGDVHRTEDDVAVRTTGLHVGPLRVIRESEVRGRLLLGFYSAPVRDNFIFYPHGFILPTTIRLTPAARMIARNLTLRIAMDLNPSAAGMTFQSSPELPAPVTIDGRGGRRGGQRPLDWYLLRRGNIGLLGWLQAPAAVTADVALYYNDAADHPDPPEAVSGELADHGFIYYHAGTLPAGEIRLSSYAWVLHGAALEEPAAAWRAFATRPVVRVQ